MDVRTRTLYWRCAAPGAGCATERTARGIGQRQGRPLIYLDTSVALAHLLAEDVAPRATLWSNSIVSSRLLEYELWVRLNARGVSHSHGELARQLLQRVAFIELAPPVLSRALEPFPTPVRTLDALHLASIDFLRRQNQYVELATYDARLKIAATKLGLPIVDL